MSGGRWKVNTAPSVIVRTAAAASAVSLDLLSTTDHLGATGAGVTLKDSAGATVATGTVGAAGARTIAVSALAASIVAGRQLWASRAPGVAAGALIKARFGSTGGGTAAADAAQVIAATDFADADGVVGEALTAGDGQQVFAHLR